MSVLKSFRNRVEYTKRFLYISQTNSLILEAIRRLVFQRSQCMYFLENCLRSTIKYLIYRYKFLQTFYDNGLLYHSALYATQTDLVWNSNMVANHMYMYMYSYYTVLTPKLKTYFYTCTIIFLQHEAHTH